MSTRATYKLINTDYKGNIDHAVEAYIHYDGYEEGALFYYLEAIRNMKNVKGGFAEAFLYGNAKYCEITTASHHGDTEFHYEMSKTHVKIFTKNWDDNEFKVQGYYTSEQFFAKYGSSNDWVEEREEFMVMDGSLVLVSSVKEKIEDKLKDWYRFTQCGATGNASSSAKDLYSAIIEARESKPECFRDEARYLEQIRDGSEKFAEAYRWHENLAIAEGLVRPKTNDNDMDFKTDMELLPYATVKDLIKRSGKKWNEQFYGTPEDL